MKCLGVFCKDWYISAQHGTDVSTCEYMLNHNITIQNDVGVHQLTFVGINCVFHCNNSDESFTLTITSSSKNSSSVVDFESLVFENIRIISADTHINILKCEFRNTNIDINWKIIGFVTVHGLGITNPP